MYGYVFTVFVGWILWKLCTGLLTWWRMRLSVRTIPLITDNHWLFGLFHKIKNLDDFGRLGQEYIESKPVKWFKAYYLFLFPVIYPVHPDTMRAVLTASGIPKNTSLVGGAHRLMRPWIGDGLLISNGAKWERNRRLLTPAFHFDILKPYVTVFSEVTDIFLTKLKTISDSKCSADVLPLVSRLTLHNMLRCTLSYNDETLQSSGDEHPYVTAINRLKFLLVARVLNPLHTFDWVYARTANGKENKKHCDFIHVFSEEIIKARKHALADDKTLLEKRHLDFLDILLTARDSDGSTLTDMEIRDEVDTFMFEGHDTTASAVSWALHSLAKYPEHQNKVRQEVKTILNNGNRLLNAEDLSRLTFTTCFIKESMRMYTPVPAYTRILKEPIRIEGVDLLKGQPIDMYCHFLHHNPLVWENHMEFRPERFYPENIDKKDPYAFLPFSAGHRNCIGQHFAMNEIKVIIAKVVQNFEISLDPKKDAELFPEIVMSAKNGIYLYFNELK